MEIQYEQSNIQQEKRHFYFRGGFIIKFKDSKMETNKNNIILDIQKVKEYNYQLDLNNYQIPSYSYIICTFL